MHDNEEFNPQKEYQQKINKMKKNNFHELMEIAYEKGSLVFNEKFKNFSTEYKNEHLYTFARTIEEFSRNFELGVLVKTFNSKLLKELIDLLYSGNYSNDDIIYFYGFIPNEKKSFFPVYFEEVKIYAFGVIIFNSESVNYKSIN